MDLAIELCRSVRKCDDHGDWSDQIRDLPPGQKKSSAVRAKGTAVSRSAGDFATKSCGWSRKMSPARALEATMTKSATSMQITRILIVLLLHSSDNLRSPSLTRQAEFDSRRMPNQCDIKATNDSFWFDV